MKNTLDLIARIFIAIFFYYEALDSFWFFEKTKETMVFMGSPGDRTYYCHLTIIALIVGATLVLIGYYSKFGAFLLLLYIAPDYFYYFFLLE